MFKGGVNFACYENEMVCQPLSQQREGLVPLNYLRESIISIQKNQESLTELSFSFDEHRYLGSWIAQIL